MLQAKNEAPFGLWSWHNDAECCSVNTVPVSANPHIGSYATRELQTAYPTLTSLAETVKLAAIHSEGHSGFACILYACDDI